MQQLNYNNGIDVFSTWSVSRCYNREVWSLVSSEERTLSGARGIVVVEAITRKRLVTEWEHYTVSSSELQSVEIAIVL
jgi:hypothetical protein